MPSSRRRAPPVAELDRLPRLAASSGLVDTTTLETEAASLRAKIDL
jgi:hypothetical protein